MWRYDWHTWHCSHFLPTIIPPAERRIETSRSHLTSPHQPMRASQPRQVTRWGPMRAFQWPCSSWPGLSLPMLTLNIVITRGLRPWGSSYQVKYSIPGWYPPTCYPLSSQFILFIVEMMQYRCNKPQKKTLDNWVMEGVFGRFEMFSRNGGNEFKFWGQFKLWPLPAFQ